MDSNIRKNGRMSFGFSHVEEEEVEPEDPVPSRPEREMEEALRESAAANEALARSNLAWWNDPSFRETLHTNDYSANIAFHWEKDAARKGLLRVGELRVLSEYKIMREIIWALFRPTSYFFVEKESSRYVPRENVTISSLTPREFKRIVGDICEHLSGLEDLKKFIKEIEKMDQLETCLPATYLSYTSALEQLFVRFHMDLVQLEEYIMKQDGVTFISHVVDFLRPWLNLFRVVHSSHCRAVPNDWRQLDNWKCAVRVLAVLYSSLVRCEVGWERNEMLVLFIKSLRSYLDILEKWLTQSKNYDFKDDFLITRSVSQGGSLYVRPYKSYLASVGAESGFLDSLVYHASRACSSVDFITVLRQHDTTPADHHSISVKIYDELISGLWADAAMDVPPPRSSPGVLPFIHPSPPQGRLDESQGEMLVRLEETLVGIMGRCLPTEGFAKQSLLSRYLLLERLAAVKLVYLFHSSHMIPFASYLFGKVVFGKVNSYQATSRLREAVGTSILADDCTRFQVVINTPVLVTNTSFFGKLDAISITYSPPPVLEMIINKDILEKYNDLFKLHLKLQWSLRSLTTIRLKDIKGESPTDSQLFSLRLFLMHTVQSLSNYLSSVVGDQWDHQMSDVCAIARDINVITAVHDKSVDCWRKCSFLIGAPQCLSAVLEVLLLCGEFKLTWVQRAVSSSDSANACVILPESLESLSKRYQEATRNLASSLNNLCKDPFHSKHSHFGHLRDEITTSINNMPEDWNCSYAFQEFE